MRRGDDGSVSLYAVITMVALFAALGLVADGGAAINTKGRAIAHAYAAARAGAQEMSAGTFAVTGTVRTDPVAARMAALRYLAVVGAADDATVTITGAQVHVMVRLRQPARILSMLGFDGFTVRGAGSASAIYGVRERS